MTAETERHNKHYTQLPASPLSGSLKQPPDRLRTSGTSVCEACVFLNNHSTFKHLLHICNIIYPQYVCTMYATAVFCELTIKADA